MSACATVRHIICNIHFCHWAHLLDREPAGTDTESVTRAGESRACVFILELYLLSAKLFGFCASVEKSKAGLKTLHLSLHIAFKDRHNFEWRPFLCFKSVFCDFVTSAQCTFNDEYLWLHISHEFSKMRSSGTSLVLYFSRVYCT